MKGSSMTTHMGNITIDNEVIGQYAEQWRWSVSASLAWALQ